MAKSVKIAEGGDKAPPAPFSPIQISVRGFFYKGKYYEASRQGGKFIFAVDDEEVMKHAAKHYGVR